MPPSLRLDENAKAMLGEEITIQELLEACQGLKFRYLSRYNKHTT